MTYPLTCCHKITAIGPLGVNISVATTVSGPIAINTWHQGAAEHLHFQELLFPCGIPAPCFRQIEL